MKRCVILLAFAISCNGQLAEFLFPQVLQAARGVVEFSRTPLVSLSKTTGDVLSAVSSVTGSGPDAVARALGLGNTYSTLANIYNAIESNDKSMEEYINGIGNEDAELPITVLVPKYGYPIEQHEVITEDGYVLTLYRIPGNGSVVFLMHGLLSSADDFILLGPENGLAYLLANEGNDVWLGNARGNKHSRRHVQRNPSEPIFWNFSWHEIGVYDLPAMIDYVLDITNQTNLTYMGHSQGTTSFFVMASTKPDYNNKISLMIALSPVAFMSRVKSPIVRFLAPGTTILHELSESLGILEFLPDSDVMKSIKTVVCGNGALSQIICSNVLFLIAGYDYPQMNFTNLPVILGHTPSGAAAKQFVHYGQGVMSGDFRQFDYGAATNLERYGTVIPPSYPLEKVTAPVSLFYSDADWLAHPDDVDILYNNLGNAVDIFKIPNDQFNHLDFIWAKDFKALIYKRIRKLIKHFLI